MSPHRIEPCVSPKSLSSYGISKNGFLPAEPPLHLLPDKYYYPWESVIEDVSALVETQQIRQRIDELPVLKTSLLKSEAEWQRAYLILTVLAQGYIWQGPEPSEVMAIDESLVCQTFY
jgi:indoleamine 2,3-dioxygenase